MGGKKFGAKFVACGIECFNWYVCFVSCVLLGSRVLRTVCKGGVIFFFTFFSVKIDEEGRACAFAYRGYQGLESGCVVLQSFRCVIQFCSLNSTYTTRHR